jgi:hypothetical protein
MSSKKLTLKQMQVNSFATDLQKEEMENVKGGAVYIRGQRFNFRVRWTTVDTRAEVSEANSGNGHK